MAHDDYDHLRESADTDAILGTATTWHRELGPDGITRAVLDGPLPSAVIPAEVWCSRCELPSTVERDGVAYCQAHDPVAAVVQLTLTHEEAAAIIDEVGEILHVGPALADLRRALLAIALAEAPVAAR